jgi:FixJ family two-component response regulator
MTDASIVHVVEDDASTRRALMRVLTAAGFESRGYAAAAEFLLSDRGDCVSCLILDVGLPGLSGVELQHALARDGDRIPVIFLTGRGDVRMTAEAMKAGAVDFLTKPVKRDVLLAAVREALHRDRSERVRVDGARALQARFEKLTARERQVLQHVIHGKLNKQIAHEIGTSVRTVKAHRAQVMRKMDAHSIADLVATAAQLKETSAVR